MKDKDGVELPEKFSWYFKFSKYFLIVSFLQCKITHVIDNAREKCRACRDDQSTAGREFKPLEFVELKDGVISNDISLRG